jgi:hypothetical protein
MSSSATTDASDSMDAQTVVGDANTVPGWIEPYDGSSPSYGKCVAAK